MELLVKIRKAYKNLTDNHGRNILRLIDILLNLSLWKIPQVKRSVVISNKHAKNLKKEGKHWGETEETPKEIVETVGETYGNTMGNGREWLGNWGSITSRNHHNNHAIACRIACRDKARNSLTINRKLFMNKKTWKLLAESTVFKPFL